MRRMLNGTIARWPAIIEGATQAINLAWSEALQTCPQVLAKGLDRAGVSSLIRPRLAASDHNQKTKTSV